MSPVYIKTRTAKSGKRYLVYWRRGGRAFREEYAGSFKTQKEAKTRRDLVAGELAAGRDPRIILDALKAAPPAAAGLAERFVAFTTSRVDVGEKARRQYRNARDRWLPILGTNRDPSTVTAEEIIEGISELYDGGEGLAPSTIQQYVSNLALVFDFAGVDPNPARSARVKIPRATRTEKAIPANVAWFAIRDHAWKRSKLALRLEEACAFRVSEACELEWGDIDFIEGMARIRRDATKTTAGRRWVPIPPELLDAVDALVPLEDRRTHARVLGVGSSFVRGDLVRACTAAGAPRYGTHVLRHRRISLWLRHGIDPVQVARWSGHANPAESLNTYGHVILDPAGDEWRAFWMGVYAADRAPGEAPVRHEEASE